jgi:hypothetical protein
MAAKTTIVTNAGTVALRVVPTMIVAIVNVAQITIRNPMLAMITRPLRNKTQT